MEHALRPRRRRHPPTLLSRPTLEHRQARAVLLLVAVLLGVGYSPKRVTILSAYVGQLLLLRAGLDASGMKDVELSTVDAYQGEENDIIVLSLTRSNERGTLGFTAIDNRVCVALSRARLGFYCCCNLDMLGDGSQLCVPHPPRHTTPHHSTPAPRRSRLATPHPPRHTTTPAPRRSRLAIPHAPCLPRMPPHHRARAGGTRCSATSRTRSALAARCRFSRRRCSLSGSATKTTA